MSEFGTPFLILEDAKLQGLEFIEIQLLTQRQGISFDFGNGNDRICCNIYCRSFGFERLLARVVAWGRGLEAGRKRRELRRCQQPVL